MKVQENSALIEYSNDSLGLDLHDYVQTIDFYFVIVFVVIVIIDLKNYFIDFN